MNSQKLNPDLESDTQLIKQNSRNLKAPKNVFNPMSEFGLGVQVIKLNK